MDTSNAFLSPYEIAMIADENKYLGKCSYFILKLHVLCTPYNRLIKAILLGKQKDV